MGSFLTATGLYLGIVRLRRRAHGRWASPYRGIMYWHHVPGLVFGAFVLTWVVSGLLSMNPWGVMETDGITEDRDALSGAAPTLAQVRSLIEAVPRNSPTGVVSIRSALLDGKLYAISTSAEGVRERFAIDGTAAPLTEDDIDRAAQRLVGNGNPVRWTTLTTADAYHYSVRNERAQLPAIRVESTGTPRVLYYLDPASGELIDKADANGRAYRWWHSALHRLDFAPALRTSFARSALMLPLLLGAAGVCVIGAYLLAAWRWLRTRLRANRGTIDLAEVREYFGLFDRRDRSTVPTLAGPRYLQNRRGLASMSGAHRPRPRAPSRRRD